MAYWIKDDVGRLVNLDRLDKIVIQERYTRIYENGEKTTEYAVIGESHNCLHCICTCPTLEEAQEFLDDLYEELKNG